MRSSLVLRSVLAGLALGRATAAIAQSDLSVGPFLGYQTDGLASNAVLGVNVLTGMAPIAFRGNAFTALGHQPLSANGFRPFGGDADVVLSFGGGSRLRGAYVLAGVGMTARDSGGSLLTHYNWSYGGGVAVPIGSALSAMMETRYTMRHLDWPDAATGNNAQPQFRIGLTYRLGSNGVRSTGPASLPRGPGGSRPLPPPTPRYPATVRASPSASRLLSTADDFLGVQYVYGGSSPSSGFDCSGFTQYVFARHNVRLPRTSRQQAEAGARVPAQWSALIPGDLVMFAEPGEAISHVAIYAGNDQIIHSTSSGGGVRYDDLTTSRGRWFVQHMVAARRVLGDGRSLVDFAKAFAGAPTAFDPPDKAPPIRRP